MDVETFADFPDAVFVVEGSVVVRANLSAAEMLERPIAELSGIALATVLAPGEEARLWELQRQQDAGWAPPATCRLRFVARSGREVLTDVRFIRSHGGDRTVVSARDISEARRGESLVARLAEIAARVGVTGGADALLDASESVFLELGWTVAYSALESDATRPLRVIGSPDDPVAVYGRSLVGRRLDFTESPIAGEALRTQRAIFLDNVPTLARGPINGATSLDASMREAQVRRSVWCPIWGALAPTHLLSIAGADITEHDFVALQLFAAQMGAAARAAELQAELVRGERLAAMGRMSAVLAHEIRTPIAVIFNALAALRHEAVSPEVRGLHGIIDEESRRLREVTGAILDFARPGDAHVVDVSLADVVVTALAAARQHPSVTSAVAPVVSISPDVGLVRADRELLRRALINLLVNAFAHAVSEPVRVTCALEGGDARVMIANDGPPIDANARRRIFEPFFTTRAEGIGLGLFIVRRAAEACGGQVTLDEVPTGVQFSLWLARGGAR
ncbi:MAG: ATP-binding protein [Polyangiaceae bacterium]